MENSALVLLDVYETTRMFLAAC